jgi:glyoxylase-like metal-dependent hydrolase (beta-lactamase superfamily II)
MTIVLCESKPNRLTPTTLTELTERFLMRWMKRILPLTFFSLLAVPMRAESRVTTVDRIADGVWMAQTDQGVNAGWFLVGDEVVAVDTGSDAETGKALLQKIAETAGRPVRFLIITHAHGDHAGGIGPFVAAGATVLCQENAAPPVSQLVASEGKSRSGLMAIFDGLGLVGGTRRVAIYYMGPAHSRGDLVVFLPDDKVLFPGDVVSTTKAPYMQSADVDPSGWESLLTRLLQIDADRVAPGHGAAGKKESIAATLAYVRKVNQLAKEMIAENVPDALVEAKIHFKEEASTVNPALIKNVTAAMAAEKAKAAAATPAVNPTAPARTPTPRPKKK